MQVFAIVDRVGAACVCGVCGVREKKIAGPAPKTVFPAGKFRGLSRGPGFTLKLGTFRLSRGLWSGQVGNN